MREALELRYLADLPPVEVAARLGLTLNTLDARLSRARRQLRGILSGPLRERAIEFGLALAPADGSGWRDTSLWCHFCGQARLLGILEDSPDGAGGRLILRCPRCYQQAGIVETDIPSLVVLRGLTSFRPAMKRLMRLGVERVAPALRDLTPCYICGIPLRARIAHGSELPADALLAREPLAHYFIISRCPACGHHITGAAAIAARNDPRALRFILERQRWIVEPEEIVAYDSLPAIRFSLYDLATRERLIYFADPETLDLRGVHPA
jgi:hypothetical protein